MTSMASNNYARFISYYIKKVLRSELFSAFFQDKRTYSFKVPYNSDIDPWALAMDNIIVNIEHGDKFSISSEYKLSPNEKYLMSEIYINIFLSDSDQEDSFEYSCAEIEASLSKEFDHSIAVQRNIDKYNDDNKFSSLSHARKFYTSSRSSIPVLNDIFENYSERYAVESEIKEYAKSVGNKVKNAGYSVREVDILVKDIEEWMLYLAYSHYSINKM